MKNTFSKFTALALAGVMSFGTIAAVPMTALAEEAPAIEAQAITSYYNYGDWRINQLDRLIDYINRLNITPADANHDITILNNAIGNIRALDYYGYWGVYDRYGRRGIYDYDFYDYDVYYDARTGTYQRYDARLGKWVVVDNDWTFRKGYSRNWDTYYYDYIADVDSLVNSAINNLKNADAKNYFWNVLDREYWGYRNWDDYYRYWNNGRPYYYYETTTTKTVASTSVYRLLNQSTGEHAFTASSAVRDEFVSKGWVAEGTGWKAPQSEGTAVYQLTKGNKYFYTKDTNERDVLVASGYSNDGVAFYSYNGSTSKPVYRLYNGKGKHFFTASTSERDSLVSRGWKNEGVAFYAM